MTDVTLHCMICYEEFDLKDHYPVVLPCGHTYVCVVCAKRLKKCMECREPLFWNPPQPKQPQHQPPSYLGRSPGHPRSYTGRVGRYSPGTNTLSAPQTPPHPSTVPEKKEEVPLPCPKNVVLLEMIEAKERQQRLLLEARQKEYEQRLHRQQERQLQKLQDQLEEEQSERQQSDEDYNEETTSATTPPNNRAVTPTPTVDGNLIDEEDDDDDDDDDEDEWLVDPTLAGMAAFSGSCGTYVVKEPLGLVVLPHDPNRSHTSDSFFLKQQQQQQLQQQQQQHNSTADEKKEQDDDLLLSVSSSGITTTESLIGDDLQQQQEEEEEPSSSTTRRKKDNMIVSFTTTTNNNNREPFSLQEGQKIQVVGVTEEGVYQLARGAGYIVATVNQLVKGTCVDHHHDHHLYKHAVYEKSHESTS